MRLAIRENSERRGTYSPNGTGWVFSTDPMIRPDGPQAMISFSNRVEPTGVVTPARTVVSSRRARVRDAMRLDRTGERAGDRDGVLGPDDEADRSPDRDVTRQVAAKT